MRFDVTLVGRLGGELVFNNHVGLLEALLHIAVAEVITADNVGALAFAFGLALFLQGQSKVRILGHAVVAPGMHKRCVGQHGKVHISDMGHDFVIDLDQLQRLLGNGCINGCNGCNGVTVIKRAIAGHDVDQDVFICILVFGQIGGCDDRLHAGKRFGL